MRSATFRLVILAAVLPLLTHASRTYAVGTITYIGVTYDQTNFQSGFDVGNAGYWFPQFNASGARSQKPTQENQRNGLPAWAGPLNHTTSIFVNYSTRSFSQDGPTRSKGGWTAWNTFTLPSGEVGLSGVLLDPYAAGNTSNTVNRIQLNAGTPASFYLRVVVDNTAGKHNAINRIRARGNDSGTDVEPNTFPVPGAANFNGIADVYTFRYDGFGGGDFIKIQFNGTPGSSTNGGSGGSSFGGVMFDVAP